MLARRVPQSALRSGSKTSLAPACISRVACLGITSKLHPITHSARFIRTRSQRRASISPSSSLSPHQQRPEQQAPPEITPKPHEPARSSGKNNFRPPPPPRASRAKSGSVAQSDAFTDAFADRRGGGDGAVKRGGAKTSKGKSVKSFKSRSLTDSRAFDDAFADRRHDESPRKSSRSSSSRDKSSRASTSKFSRGNSSTNKNSRPSNDTALSNEISFATSKPPKRNLRGNAGKNSLSPLDTIAFAEGETPRAPRQTLALADKFFRSNYRFLFASSSIQNQPPNPHTPEVVVLGASNAGKSSFLNGLFGRTDAARVSSKAGHTITMNGHGIGHAAETPVLEKGSKRPWNGLIMMDTPGYGFASRKTWGDEIHRYIQKRTMLKGAVLLIPAEKTLSPMDRWVLQLLAGCNKRTLIVITKADRAGKEWKQNCELLAEQIRNDCREMSKKLRSGWTEGDGFVPTIYATAAGWDKRKSVGSAPGLAGARRAILEDLAGLKLGKNDVEAAPELKTFGGELVSWDSLMGEPTDDTAGDEEVGVEDEAEVDTEKVDAGITDDVDPTHETTKVR